VFSDRTRRSGRLRLFDGILARQDQSDRRCLAHRPCGCDKTRDVLETEICLAGRLGNPDNSGSRSGEARPKFTLEVK